MATFDFSIEEVVRVCRFLLLFLLISWQCESISDSRRGYVDVFVDCWNSNAGPFFKMFFRFFLRNIQGTFIFHHSCNLAHGDISSLLDNSSKSFRLFSKRPRRVHLSHARILWNVFFDCWNSNAGQFFKMLFGFFLKNIQGTFIFVMVT